MSSNKYKATIALGCATAGFVASYPFSATFIGGVFHSGFLAAMVGGLADWFAVEALFRKPLGIPVRTEVIPRSRDRIVEDITGFVERELLTKENILRTLRQEENRASKMLLSYLEDHQGKAHLKALVREIILDMGKQLEDKDMLQLLRSFLVQNAGRVSLAPKVIAALEWSIKHGYDERVSDFIIGQLVRLVDSAMFLRELTGFAETVKRRYNGDSQWRSFWVDFDAADAAVKLRDGLAAFISKPNAGYRELSGFLRSVLYERLEQLKASEEERDEIEAFKMRLLETGDFVGSAGGGEKSKGLAGLFQQMAAAFGEAGEGSRVASPESVSLSEILSGEEPGDKAAVVASLVEQVIDEKIAEFKEDGEIQTGFDGWAEGKLEKLLARYQGAVGKMVKAELDKYDNARLIQMIEESVGDDLQIIRVNGAVVGGLAGMALYLVAYGVELLWKMQ